MTTYYIDNTSGSDANDGLTTGSPKKTLQAAYVLGTTGDTFLIANTSSQPVAVWTPPTSSITDVWDIGSLTAVIGDGSTVPAWHVDGGGTAAASYGIANSAVLRNAKMFNWGDSAIVSGTTKSICERVEASGSAYTQSGLGAMLFSGSETKVNNCYSHDHSITNGIQIRGRDSTVTNSTVCGVGNVGISCDPNCTTGCVVGNLIFDCDGFGIDLTDAYTQAWRNTIFNCSTGIDAISTSLVGSNIIASCTTGIDGGIVFDNAFWDCDTNQSPDTDVGNPIIEPSDPFNDADNDDYRLIATALSALTALPFGALRVVGGGGSSTHNPFRQRLVR